LPSASSLTAERPASAQAAATVLRAAAESGRRVRIVGGGTKLGWGNPAPDPDVELSTAGLDGLVEHNEGDLTAVLQAGMPVAAAQDAFARAGQMLALDPPAVGGATIGGLVATGDSGPMRHRFGAVRDLILGITVALPDGSVARAGGQVIKNVAGYDLAKLLAGSFGTLGAIVEAVFRLHPRPPSTATAVGRAGDPTVLARAAAALAHAPLELLSLDVAWRTGRGAVMARAAGSAPRPSVESAARVMHDAGAQADLIDDDEQLWTDQRAAQRARDGGLVLRVSGRAGQLADVVRAAEDEGARLVGRAGLGLFWIALEPADPPAAADAVRRLRERLSPSPCTVLDAPAGVRVAIDPWDLGDGPELALMRRLKARFDPASTCNPGLYVGGI
jgi:glycolate oxidase FAD binding subunit